MNEMKKWDPTAAEYGVAGACAILAIAWLVKAFDVLKVVKYLGGSGEAMGFAVILIGFLAAAASVIVGLVYAGYCIPGVTTGLVKRNVTYKKACVSNSVSLILMGVLAAGIDSWAKSETYGFFQFYGGIKWWTVLVGAAGLVVTYYVAPNMRGKE